MRFFPYIKRNYDYGVVIFLLTFNLITVSSYRVSNVLKIAHERFYTIAIGCGICLVMTLFIFPIWSGEDLHNSTVIKLEGLAKSIEGIHATWKPWIWLFLFPVMFFYSFICSCRWLLVTIWYQFKSCSLCQCIFQWCWERNDPRQVIRGSHLQRIQGSARLKITGRNFSKLFSNVCLCLLKWV